MLAKGLAKGAEAEKSTSGINKLQTLLRGGTKTPQIAEIDYFPPTPLGGCKRATACEISSLL